MTRAMSRVGRALLAAASLAVPVTGAPSAWAEEARSPATAIRVGNHPGFGRVVFDLPSGATSHVVAEGQRLLVVLTGAGAVIEPEALPRNVRAVRTDAGTATLDLVPGTKARPVRIGDRLVIDVLDATPGSRVVARPAAAPAKPSPAPPAGSASGAGPSPAAPEPAPPAAAAAPMPATPVMAPPVPDVRPAVPTPPPPMPTPAPDRPRQPEPVVIKADADVAAAAFRRGDLGLVVLDRRLPEQALPPGLVWTRGAVSTVVQIPLDPERNLRLSRTAAGWAIDQVPGAPAEPLEQAVAGDALHLAVTRPGRMVTILDPVSGGTLLVGASLAADKGVGGMRRTPDYRLLPTWLGVVVEPSSDQVDLRADAKGFVLTGGGPIAPAPDTALTRRFDLPDQPMAALNNRLRAQLASAAAAPPRARSPDRLAAVQSMVALGLGVEAQALVQQVVADDPQAAADAQTGALAALAAILAGRPAEAVALDDPRLSGTDEVELWRGLRDRRLGNDTPAARNLGRLAPLASAYPASLQRAIWPDMSEAAIESGVPVATDRLSAYAQAVLLERKGQVQEALAGYDRAAAGPDRLDQVRGTVKAAELRLSAGQIGPAEAAAILERQSYAWRGDAQEARFRLRAAELKAAAQEWRPALEALRAIEDAFPDQKQAVQRQKVAVMEGLLSAKGAGLSPLDLVLLASDYADCIPEGSGGSAMARLLADKLVALDLPARVIPVLQGLTRSTQPGEGRSELGARLAELLLEGGDAAGTLAILEASAAPALPPTLQERRGLLLARARAAAGDPASAMAGLVELGTEQADELRASLSEKAGDWRSSLSALTALAARRVPPEGRLAEDVQTLLVRQANAAVQARDATAVAALRSLAARLDGPHGDVFRLLTAAPLAGPADLPRAGVELAAARGLPTRLQAAGLR